MRAGSSLQRMIREISLKGLKLQLAFKHLSAVSVKVTGDL